MIIDVENIRSMVVPERKTVETFAGRKKYVIFFANHGLFLTEREDMCDSEPCRVVERMKRI